MTEPLNVLIVRLFAIGDVVMATSAVRLAREALPGARLHFLVGKWSAPVLEGNRDVDEIIVTDDEIFFKRRWAALARLAASLRKRRPDITVSFHGRRGLNVFLSLATGSRKFYCLSYPGKRASAAGQVPIDLSQHKVELHAQLVSMAAGGFAPDRLPCPVMTLEEQEIATGKKILASRLRSPANHVIALCPGGGKNPGSFEPVRRWGAARYAELARLIHKETGAGLVLVGSPEETPLLQGIQERTGGMAACVTDLDLRGAASLLAATSLVVGNDSGLLHIASAVGRPTLTIFGPTSPSHTRPFGPFARTVYKRVPCSPCDIKKRDHKNPLVCSTLVCMKSIEPGIVVQQLLALMHEAGIIEDRTRT
jgi:ADP-heptose:LPS heptosyltransferase